MFSPRIPLKALSILSRSLGTMLDSGVDIRKALKVAAKKSGHVRSRTALQHIVTSIGRGETIASAMEKADGAFPPLMIDMVHVGEESGALPEVLEGLANHYENLTKLRRQFIGAVIFPLLQFFAATFIIAFLIWLGGSIVNSLGDMVSFEVPEIFGMKMLGKEAAFYWLTTIYSLIAGLIVLYFVLKNSFAGQQLIDPFLMKIPLVGKCMRAFAISRFSWAFYLTQQTGMPITKSLDYSLRATSNGMFIAASSSMQRTIKEGTSFVETLEGSELFPADFIEVVTVAETSGTVPEELNRLSPQFESEARRRLNVLINGFSLLIWGAVAAMIITVVITVALAYVSLINDLSSEI